MAIEKVLWRSRHLQSLIDDQLETASKDTTLVGFCDWAWYRFSTVSVLVRDGGSAVTAAGLTRSLLEEAALWDWKAATGADPFWMAGQASAELERLARSASELQDDVWTWWLLPPGSSLLSPGDFDPPADVRDAVKRIGHGLSEELLSGLPVDKLLAVYQLLDALAHGNLVASGAVAAEVGYAGSRELSALILHIAGSACAVVALVSLDLDSEGARRISAAAADLALTATAIHGVEGGATTRTARPAKVVRRAMTTAESSIVEMPGPPPQALEAGRRFVAQAYRLVRDHASSLTPNDAISQLAIQAFQSAVAQLEVLGGALNGQMGLAVIPFAARPVMEEGARWRWATSGIEEGSDEFRRRLKTLLRSNAGLVSRIFATFQSQAVAEDVVERLLGGATHLREIAAGLEGEQGERLPRKYIEVGYSDIGDSDWAVPIYGILSQFMHATPIAYLHLRRADWTSLTAPMFCVALDGFVQGFTVLAEQTLALAGGSGPSRERDLIALAETADEVRMSTSAYHFIG